MNIIFIFCILVNSVVVSALISIIPSSLHAHSYAVFLCRLSGSTGALSWRAPNGVTVENSERTKITSYVHESELNITELRASDSGEYTCTDGSDKAFAQLTVRIYPRITYAPSVQNFTEGQEACIICTVDLGTPPEYSSVRWMGPSSNALLPALNTSTCVCIQRIAPRDAGLYQCVIDANGYRSISRSIEVHVHPRDLPTESPSGQLENRKRILILTVHGSICHPALVHFITWHIQNYMISNCSCSVIIANDTLQCTNDDTGVYTFEVIGPSAQALNNALLASIALGRVDVPMLDFHISVKEDSNQYLSHAITTGMGVVSVCLICGCVFSCLLQKRKNKSPSSLMSLLMSNNNCRCLCQSRCGPQQTQCPGETSCTNPPLLQTLHATIESSDNLASSSSTSSFA
ncbi:hypothetical protein EMCRGX_G015792 [Ephydatia muelleri]